MPSDPVDPTTDENQPMSDETMTPDHSASVNRIHFVSGETTDMLRVLEDFRCAVDSPELADQHRRILTEKTELGSTHRDHANLVMSLRSRTHPVHAELIHPMEREDERTAPSFIAQAILEYDQNRSAAVYDHAFKVMRAIAQVLAVARPRDVHLAESRKLRVAFPNPWQKLVVTDGNLRPILTPQAIDRVRLRLPGLYNAFHDCKVRPGFRKPIEAIRISRIVNIVSVQQTDDPMEIMRLAAVVDISPEDILPDTGPRRK